MTTVLQLSDVSVTREGTTILDSVEWSVASSGGGVILGPNGAGKTTILQIAAAFMHPSRGTATVLDQRIRGTAVFGLRPPIRFPPPAMARRIPVSETVLDVVLTAAYSVTGRWNEQYEDL